MMMLKPYKYLFAILLLLFGLVCGCAQPSGDGSVVKSSSAQTEQLPNIVFRAFVDNQPDEFADRIMNATRFQSIPEVADSLASISKDELDNKPFEQSNESFKVVREKLSGMGFDWKSAALSKVMVRQRKGDVTEQVAFEPAMNTQRLDLYLYLASGGHTAVLKIDDTYKIADKRYVSGGFRLEGFE
jgi:hypothetical protein